MILEQYELLIGDFHSEYGAELEDLLDIKSWRWFTFRVNCLMAADTRIARFFSD